MRETLSSAAGRGRGWPEVCACAGGGLSGLSGDVVKRVKTYWTNLGMMLVRRKVRVWKREKVAKGMMVTAG